MPTPPEPLPTEAPDTTIPSQARRMPAQPTPAHLHTRPRTLALRWGACRLIARPCCGACSPRGVFPGAPPPRGASGAGAPRGCSAAAQPAFHGGVRRPTALPPLPETLAEPPPPRARLHSRVCEAAWCAPRTHSATALPLAQRPKPCVSVFCSQELWAPGCVCARWLPAQAMARPCAPRSSRCSCGSPGCRCGTGGRPGWGACSGFDQVTRTCQCPSRGCSAHREFGVTCLVPRSGPRCLSKGVGTCSESTFQALESLYTINRRVPAVSALGATP